MKSFFAELKRRNVYKVAVAYVVVSWLLIQATSILFPTFDVPTWVMKGFVVLLVLGLPVALIFSWAFELTPEGIKRESEVQREGSIAVRTGRRIVALTIVVALVAAGLLAFSLLRPVGGDRVAANSNQPAENGLSLPIPEKSIAVLPFENLSSDQENAYFADGIQDEILTRLSKVAAIKVISRTSTQKYKSAPDNLREIGRQLGVANILEGSVQKVANAVLVNVQLIRAATDEHLWAESYHRKLDDVFGVEGEVASAIAEQLNTKLSGAEEKAVTDKPTQNAAAYDAFLRGIAIGNSGNLDSMQRVAAAFAEATRLDPKFALAWARLGIARSLLYFNGVEPAINSAAAVKEAAERALALQPDCGEAWVAQGVYRYRVLRDFPAALQSYQEALQRLPNSSLVFEEMGHVERRLGSLDAAEKHYQAAAQLDPRSLDTLATLADVLQSSRRFAEAETVLDRILEISPGDEQALTSKAFLYQSQGRLDASATELTRIPADSRNEAIHLARALQLVYERHFNVAVDELQRDIAASKSPDPRLLCLLGFCQARSGKIEDGRASCERAIAAMNPSPGETVPVDARILPSFLAWAYAGLGEKDKALAQANRAVAVYQDDVLAKPFTETVRAQIQAQFGDFDSAMSAFPHLLEVPNGVTLANLRIDPFWDPLRHDPRFQKLTAVPAATQ